MKKILDTKNIVCFEGRNKKGEHFLEKVDKRFHYKSRFYTANGFYKRSGVIDADGYDTGEDPFMSSYPELIDVGVMGHCVHGSTGLCIKSGVECYQNGLGMKVPNMSLENFKRIVDECYGRTFQLALGGRGDVDQHENFEEILAYCRSKNIVPNFTSSGLGFTDEIVALCKKYCGSVAISWYRQEHTYRAIQMLLDAGVSTNVHYVVGNNSIDEAIERLENDDFPKGIQNVIFLLHKNVGLGSDKNVLKYDDPRVARFYELIDTGKFSFQIGLDSCNVAGLVNFTNHIDPTCFDTCEAARWSMYITSDMKAIPCSFDNQELKWAFDISEKSIEEAWNSKEFNDFRMNFLLSCPNCKDRHECRGGCPIRREIVLCNREEKKLFKSPMSVKNN